MVHLAREIGMNNAVENGFKAFPNCTICQCYPECRVDCPDHQSCLDRLPEYKISDLVEKSAQLGREQLKLQVIRWLNTHQADIPYIAQIELMRILGMKIL